jgi:NAD(P)-dependent dehydrogenase (short-subunit alcohol dehydrogenase family)
MAEGKVGIVTGAGRPWGLGRATALGLARKGMDIVLAEVRDDWGEEAVENIQRETGRSALYVRTDISDRDSVDVMVGQAVKRFGRIDALCNVAGITARVRLEEMDEETYDRVMNVNLKGIFVTCKAVLPTMKAQGSGRIVNVSSGGALQPLKGLGAYSAAKAGVIALSKIMAWEWAPYGVVVMVVAPGRLGNAMGSDEGPGVQERELGVGAQPFKVLMTPADVAEVMVYAATSEGHAMTGQTLHANGGGYMV